MWRSKDRQAGGTHRVGEPLPSLAGRRDGEFVAQMGDSAMSGVDQMLGGLDRGLVVVGEHGVGDQSDRWAVDEDHGKALLPFGLQVAMVGADRGEDQPVDPAPAERLDHRPLAFRIVVGARREHRRLPLRGDLLDRAVDRCREGIVHRVEEQSEGEGLPVTSPQRAGSLVRLEVQRDHGALDPLPHLGRYVGLVVDHAGNRLDSDAGQRGHVANRRAGPTGQRSGVVLTSMSPSPRAAYSKKICQPQGLTQTLRMV